MNSTESEDNNLVVEVRPTRNLGTWRPGALRADDNGVVGPVVFDTDGNEIVVGPD